MVSVDAPLRSTGLGSHGTVLVPSALSARLPGHADAERALRALAVPTFDSAEAAVRATGADRVEGVLTRFVADLIGADYFRDWITHEPGRALRILTTRSSPVHRRFVAVT